MRFLLALSPANYVVSDQQRRLRVLIVDDERDSLLSLGLLCREEGMEVRLLRDAASVEAVVAEFRRLQRRSRSTARAPEPR